MLAKACQARHIDMCRSSPFNTTAMNSTFARDCSHITCSLLLHQVQTIATRAHTHMLAKVCQAWHIWRVAEVPHVAVQGRPRLLAVLVLHLHNLGQHILRAVLSERQQQRRAIAVGTRHTVCCVSSETLGCDCKIL